MNYKIVKLKKVNEEYRKAGLNEESLGIVLGEKDGYILVMFFNKLNQGDYLVLPISKLHLEISETRLPEKLCSELEEYILNNTDKILAKNTFKENPFNECDYVELIVEKEKYTKYGLHKGARGVVALNRASKNEILVEFSVETEIFDEIISVDFEDVKKVEATY
jgi:hypothetical protein